MLVLEYQQVGMSDRAQGESKMSTNERLTKEQIDAIRERADNATTGPWVRWEGWDDADNSVSSDGREDAPTIADLITEKADAEFISRAREDVPALLAEVERLREELAKAREVTNDMVERAAEAWYVAQNPGREDWALSAWADMGGSEPSEERSVATLAAHAALTTALGGGDDAR